MSHPGGKRCRFCDAGINAHQAVQGQVCAADSCRRRKLSEDIRRREDLREKTEAAHFESLSTRIRALSAGHPRRQETSGDQALGVAIVPSNCSPPVRLTDARRLKFEAHLNRAIDQYEASEPGKMELREAGIIRDQESDEINDRACGACRGLCCSRGGDHAFITQSTILRYGLQHPGSERQDIIDDYVSFLGDEISEGGCVFQGSKGCTLPRVMRSNVCNTFFCSGLKSMYETEKNPSIEVIAIAACRGSEIDRIDIFVTRDRMRAGSGDTRSLEKS